MIIYTIVECICGDKDTNNHKFNVIRSFTHKVDAESFSLECNECTDIIEHQLDGLIDATTDSDESQRLMLCEVYIGRPDCSDE